VVGGVELRDGLRSPPGLTPGIEMPAGLDLSRSLEILVQGARFSSDHWWAGGASGQAAMRIVAGEPGDRTRSPAAGRWLPSSIGRRGQVKMGRAVGMPWLTANETL